MLEVSCNIKQLRSRAAFVLLNAATGTLFLWHGCKVTKTASKVSGISTDKIIVYVKKCKKIGLILCFVNENVWQNRCYGTCKILNILQPNYLILKNDIK